MITTPLATPCGRAARLSLAILVFVGIFALISPPLLAQEGGNQGQESTFGDDNRGDDDHGKGDNGDTGPKGYAGPSRAAATSTGAVTLPTNGLCTNIGSVSITLPRRSPAGLLIATAKVGVKINHIAGTIASDRWDRGFLTFSLSRPLPTPPLPTGPPDPACVTSEANKSYFSVPPGWPGTGLGTPLEFTVFVQAPHDLDAGGAGPYVFYLNGMMVSGATTTDSLMDANIVLEFLPK